MDSLHLYICRSQARQDILLNLIKTNSCGVLKLKSSPLCSWWEIRVFSVVLWEKRKGLFFFFLVVKKKKQKTPNLTARAVMWSLQRCSQNLAVNNPDTSFPEEEIVFQVAKGLLSAWLVYNLGSGAGPPLCFVSFSNWPGWVLFFFFFFILTSLLCFELPSYRRHSALEE
jgi:hypothetical protein